jgi:putative lipoic acid-binding regulatory protein
MPQESLIEFPCSLAIKVMGHNTPDFQERMVAAAAMEVGPLQDKDLSTRPSRDGRFISLTMTVNVQDHDHLRRVYTALHATGLVLYAL